jgi:hypothetical protein
MKAIKTPQSRHQKLQASYLKQIAQIGPFVEGSLCKYKRWPGSKSVSWRLTYKLEGKTQTVYVPVCMVEEVREWTKEYRRLKELIRKVTKQSMALVHRYSASQQAASRRRASTRR